jgi:hypothetical protein
VATLYPAPSPAAIETLVAGLVSVPNQVKRAPADDPERDAAGVFAEYITDDDQLAILGFADHNAINFVGGAMLDLDCDALVDASAKGVVLDDGFEGFGEVLNVFASCFNTDYTPHLRLGSVHRLPGQLTDEVKQLWRQPRARRPYSVSIEDQGAGVLILYIA